jgi:hypothetical protein
VYSQHTAPTPPLSCSVRYQREFKDGKRSVVKQMLEQDIPSTVPMVLLVSEIRTSSSTRKPKPQQQQQQQTAPGAGAPSSAAGAGAAGGACEGDDVKGMQLSDGWYCVNAQVDRPLAQFVLAKRIKVRASSMYRCRNGTGPF